MPVYLCLNWYSQFMTTYYDTYRHNHSHNTACTPTIWNSILMIFDIRQLIIKGSLFMSMPILLAISEPSSTLITCHYLMNHHHIVMCGYHWPDNSSNFKRFEFEESGPSFGASLILPHF